MSGLKFFYLQIFFLLIWEISYSFMPDLVNSKSKTVTYGNASSTSYILLTKRFCDLWNVAFEELHEELLNEMKSRIRVFV